MIIAFIHHHEGLLLLKATWKTPYQLCYSLPAWKCSFLCGSPCVQYNLPGGWVVWKEEEIADFVFQSRKGNKYLILWLYGSVASNRICSFVSGLQNLLSGGLASCTRKCQWCRGGRPEALPVCKEKWGVSGPGINIGCCLLCFTRPGATLLFSHYYRTAVKCMLMCGLFKGLCSPV